MNSATLVVLWIAWCACHSLLIDPAVVGWVRRRAAWLTRYYRLLYNLWSLASFVPLLVATDLAAGPVVFRWPDWAVTFRFLLLGTAGLLFYGGARQYDLGYFLGLRQLRSGRDHLLLSDGGGFVTSGVFGVTRHPWYLGGLLLLWTIRGEYPLPLFLATSVMSGYLVVGTILEERKIVAVCGERYRAYQRQVSMLLPWKWLVGRLRSGRGSRKES